MAVFGSILTDILPFCLTVQNILSEGGVPPRPVVFVSRLELVNQIREKLYRLQKDPGWVTVYGMAGSGKSVLAAEAVRHHSIIEGFFFVFLKTFKDYGCCFVLLLIIINQLITCPLFYSSSDMSTCRVLPWRDPLVVHWPVGQARFTG